MHPLSLAFLTVPDISPVEAITIAAEAGFDLVGLRLLPVTAAEPSYPLLTGQGVLREVSAALRDTGIGIGEIEIVRLVPSTEIANYGHFIERAAQLGARHIVVMADDDEDSRIVDNFARLCEMAAPHGMTVDLEPMPYTAVRNIAHALSIVKSAAQTNSGIQIDALHFHRAGSQLEEIRTLPASCINIFQLCDAPAAFDPRPAAMQQLARNGRLMPGEGELDLSSMLSAIPDKVTVSIEVPNRDLIARMSARERAGLAMQATQKLFSSAGGHAGSGKRAVETTVMTE